MLDQNDLDQIQAMITESEARTNARIDALGTQTNARIDALEAQTNARFDSFEARIDAKFVEQEKNIMQNVHVLMESEFRPQFQLLTEMIQSILDRLPETEEMEDYEDRLQVLEATARRHSREIAALKRAN